MKHCFAVCYLSLVATCILTGCAALKSENLKTLGEKQASFSYIPLDPLPIHQVMGDGCDSAGTAKPAFKALLACLPDQAVRLAVGEFDLSGGLTFGPAKIGVEGQSYQVILDYISADVSQLPVYVQRTISSGPRSGQYISIYEDSISAATQYRVSAAPMYWADTGSDAKQKGELVILPVYIGVGLRLTASVQVQKGKVNLSSLGALAAEAEAGKITGTLVVQTLGVTGDNVSTILPLPSEINQTTIQNAILALGAIKAVLHDSANTIITPRVVGVYNPIGGGQQTVNGIISALARKPLEWLRPCAGG